VRLRRGKGRNVAALERSDNVATATTQTVEPVFGIIKAALGFRHFRLRGLEKVSLEWTLVTLAYNLKRLHPSDQCSKRPEVTRRSGVGGQMQRLIHKNGKLDRRQTQNPGTRQRRLIWPKRPGRFV